MAISWELMHSDCAMAACTRGHTPKHFGGPSSTQDMARREILKSARLDLRSSISMINEKAPVGSLPADVLILIFEAANGVKNKIYNPWVFPIGREKPLPMVVSQVSRFWRDVAIHSPLLWTLIDISPPWSLNIIRLFLKRSKSCPIDLRLQTPSVVLGMVMSPATVNNTASRLCEIIEPHIPRCRSISIRGELERTSPMLYTVLNTIRASRVPILEKCFLHIEGMSEFDDDDVQALPLFHHGAPALQSIRLMGPKMLSRHLPHTQVTTLHLGAGETRSMSYQEFSSTLKSCPLLHTLAVYDDLVIGFWPDNAVLDLPYLRSLEMYGTITTVSDILSTISAPQLKDLVIAPVVMDDLANFHSQQVSAPDVKFPAVKSLTLSPASTYSFGIMGLASDCFPAVEQLTIPNIHEDSFIDAFTETSTAATLWPHLTALALRNIDASNAASIPEVVSFRRRIGHPLQTLYLDYDSLTRIALMLPQLENNIDVVELDIWSIQRRDDPSFDIPHFVGNDFDFGAIPIQTTYY
ncbi:hypothetical protein BDZ94DRAFT_1257896 [Collybia nuda]|uniref:F-box domain-containing protein n=1 Tax=Collybia nuda TaxID=64659 RepID=A0A9P5YA65_9AGAR|nr:hypothetical protein BDZ94DRAFT_1257896 [Collybia nuda]